MCWVPRHMFWVPSRVQGMCIAIMYLAAMSSTNIHHHLRETVYHSSHRFPVEMFPDHDRTPAGERHPKEVTNLVLSDHACNLSTSIHDIVPFHPLSTPTTGRPILLVCTSQLRSLDPSSTPSPSHLQPRLYLSTRPPPPLHPISSPGCLTCTPSRQASLAPGSVGGSFRARRRFSPIATPGCRPPRPSEGPQAQRHRAGRAGRAC